MARNRLWGGRFAGGPSALMAEINASIDTDKRLWREDIEGSLAHIRMLAKTGVVSGEDARAIESGLTKISGELERGEFKFSRELEDIHLNIEARLAELIGPVAGKLHTARSRNDQVAADLKLWMRRACVEADRALHDLQLAFLDQAERHAATIMPGFTHLQSAQPLTFGHHCLAYVEMFARDRERFRFAAELANECPLGAAALAGTGFPIDRDMTAKALGFAAPARNSLDSVSDRDFVLDFLYAASACALHLSRFAEEIVLWSSQAFAFIRLPDELTTGSSIMPQKRNPDAAELVRAKSARVMASLQQMMMTLKALPLGYAKDMQEDKRALFDAFDELMLSLAACAAMARALVPDIKAMREAAAKGHATATDLADWLVRELKLSFREAHRIAGRIVARADEKKLELHALPFAEFQAIEPRIAKDALAALSLDGSVASRASFGGTAPSRVSSQIAFWRGKLT